MMQECTSDDITRKTLDNDVVVSGGAHIAHVLLGDGRRLFEQMGAEHIEP
jgi:hypothetical protein